jgi:hypothetical protein
MKVTLDLSFYFIKKTKFIIYMSFGFDYLTIDNYWQFVTFMLRIKIK